MKNSFKRFLSLALVWLMVLSCASLPAFATEDCDHAYVNGECTVCGETDPNYSIGFSDEVGSLGLDGVTSEEPSEEEETSEESEEEPSEEEEPEEFCSCETDDPDYHAPYCDMYVAPEYPECLCVEKCSEGAVNEWCDVCYFDADACGASGEEEGVVLDDSVAKVGNDFTGYTSADAIWGEVWGNASESFVIKVLDANDNVMGTTSLNNIGGIIDGDVNVSWNIKFDAVSNTDEYWSMSWTTAPTVDNMPAKVELWVDGVKVSGGVVVLNAPDDLNKIVAATTDDDGKILACYTDLQEAIKAAAPAGTVELLRDVTVDEWIMFAENLNISNGDIITLNIDGLTINGNNHTLTISSIESAGNGGYLFYDAENLTVNDLTIEIADGLVGGIGLKSGTIKNVTFNGGKYGVLPGAGGVTVTDCTFTGTKGYAIYFEDERPDIVVTGNTFNTAFGAYAITMRDNEQFTNNTIIAGRVNLADTAKSTVSGNDFGTERLKVYNGATAVISGNTINNLEFDKTAEVTNSTFDGNALGESAQAALDALPTIKGSGNVDDPYKISNAEELIFFRDSVNAGKTKYNAPGVYVALVADIDMAGATWERGIGDGINATFDGIFDGNNKTIKNLNFAPEADSDGYLCGGLFGYTYGAAVIKNLVLENITVTAAEEGHNVGALVGFAYNKGGKLTVSNVTVTDVKIDAPNAYGVGAIVGYSYYAMGTIEDCSVDGATITGYSFVGGITGYSYSDAVITGCSVNKATIKATSKGAGGIAGLANGNNVITDNTVTETRVSADEANWGYVVGELGASSAKITNNNAPEPQLGGDYETGKAYQAKIGDKYYTTLTAALAAAQADETIELLAPVVVAAGEEVEIDLAGKIISVTISEKLTKSFAAITNKGTLTIRDTVGGGKISVDYTGASFGYGVGLYTISNEGGTLTIEGGTIENLANVSGSMYDAIDNNSTLGETVLEINGGAVICNGYIAIRQFCNGTNNENIVNISGGTVTGGNTSVWMQNPNSNANLGELKITAGTVNGRLLLGDSTSFVPAVSGGTFSVEVPEAYCADGFIPTMNADGTYGVKEGAFIARNDRTGAAYETFDAAYKAANDGDTIVLLETAEIDGRIVYYSTKAVTIKAQGLETAFLVSDTAFMVTFAKMTVESDGACITVGVNPGAYGPTVDIYGGTYNGGTSAIVAVSGLLSIHNGTFSAESANTIESDKKFVSVKGGSFDFDPSEYLVAKYVATEGTDGIWGVIPAAVMVDADTDTYYATLAEAFEAAQTGDTVKLLQDAELSETVKVNANVTLDLGGKTITGTDNETKSFALIEIQPGKELTITGDGKITLTATTNREWSAYSSVISNQRGKLTVNGGTIEHLGGTDMAYAIDVLTNTGAQDAEAVINGGTIKSTYRAIRQFLNSTTGENILTVNDGTIEGANKSIWMQNANANTNPGELTVGEMASVKGDVLISGNGAAKVDMDVNISADALEDGNTVTGNKLPAGYEIAENNGVYGVMSVAAKINGIPYSTLEDAIEEAEDNDTITLNVDIALTETLTISADKTITLDLNGKTVSMVDNSGATAALIKNNGNLTIMDSGVNGKITFKTTIPSAANAYASNTISNHGVITINSGTIENTSTGGACYALDNYAGSTATINGGKLVAEKTTVRIFNWTDGDAAKATLNVTGGEILSNDGYGININSGNAPAVELNITGGTVTTNDIDYNLAVYVVNKGTAENQTIEVTGGTFNGYFALNGVTCTTMAENKVSISGGTFEGVVCYETPVDGFITGGTFKTPVEEAFCAEGFIPTENNGSYGVKLGAYVAQIGEVKYETIADAVSAAQDGDTVKVMADIDLANETSVLLDNAYNTYYKADGKSITIDLNGKTISGKYTDTSKMMVGLFSTENNGHLTITGDGFVNVTATGTVYSLIANYEPGCSITIENGTFTLDKADDSLIYSGSDAGENEGITVKGGNFTLFNVGTGSNGKPWIFNTLGSNDRNVNVSGGTFNFNVNKQYWAHEVDIVDANGNLSYVNDNGNGTWTVTGMIAEAGIVEYPNGYERCIGYATFEDAFASAKADDTIKIFTDVSCNEINVDKSVKIVTNNYKIEGKFVINSADVTLTAPEGLDVITTVKNSYVEWVDGVYKVNGYEAKTADGKFHKTLEEAVKYANEKLDRTTITLLKNVELDETLVIDTGAIKAIGTANKTIKSTADVAIRIAKGTKSLYIRGVLDTSEAPAGSVAIQIEKTGNDAIKLENATINAGANVAIKLTDSAKAVAITDSKINAGQFIVSKTSGTVNVEMQGSTVTINGNSLAAIEIYGGKLLVINSKDEAKNKNTIRVTGEHVVYVASDIAENYDRDINFAEDTGFFEVMTYKTITKEPDYKTYVTDIASIKDKLYFSLEDAIAAAEDGDTVILMNDIELTWDNVVDESGYSVLIQIEGKSITLDMNGKTISVDHQSTTDRIYAVVYVADGASLTVTGNGGIDVKTHADSPKVAYMFWKRGTTGNLTIENGTYHMNNSEDSMVYTNGDEIVNVKGGTWTLDEVGTRVNGFPCIFNTTGSGERGINVSGGTFNFNVNEQYWAHEVDIVDANGNLSYVIDNGDNTWTVTGKTAEVGIVEYPNGYKRCIGYATFKDAVASIAKGAGETTIELQKDITVKGQFIGHSYAQKVVIDLNGHTMSSTDKALTVYRGGTVVTIMNGTVSGNTTGGTIQVTYGGKLTLGENVTVKSGGQATAIKVDANSTLIIDQATAYVLGGKNDLVVADGAKVVISAGNFKKPVKAEWCAEGYIPTEKLENGYYSVEKDPAYGMAAKVENATGVSYYETLAEAIKEAETASTITLLTDINVDAEDLVDMAGYPTFFLVDGKTIKIDLNGKKIYADASKLSAGAKHVVGVFATNNNGHLTITGNGTVKGYSGVNQEDAYLDPSKGNTDYNYKFYCLIAAFGENTTITIDGGNYVLDYAGDSLVYTSGNEGVKVNGGTFSLSNLGGIRNGMPWVFNARGQNQRHVVVKGGSFCADIQHQYYPFEVQMPETLALKKNADGMYDVCDAEAYIAEQILIGAKWYEKKVGYATFEEAVAACGITTAKFGGKEESRYEVVVLLKDIELENTLNIASGETVTIDLNGKTISQTKKCTASYEMIANNGSLTINDSVGTGKIILTDTGEGDSSFGWGSYTIRNNGTLVVKGGTIEFDGAQEFGTHCSLAIFQYSGSTTINGGNIINNSYRSVRLWHGGMTINNGEFEGQVWVHCVDNSASLTINGGSFAPAENGGDVSSVFVNNSGYKAELSITGGNFATKVGANEVNDLAGCITGGNFTEDAKANTNQVLFAEKVV